MPRTIGFLSVDAVRQRDFIVRVQKRRPVVETRRHQNIGHNVVFETRNYIYRPSHRRRLSVQIIAQVDIGLHGRLTHRCLSWASDGADRGVGDAATRHFENMKFRVWEESHSSVKVLEHAVKADAEAVAVDALLVSGKNPQSLAKFVSTSDVYRNRVGEAQREAGVAMVFNFGWAPQRYQSKMRPLTREARRWDPIWDSIATEAAGNNKERRALAIHYITELGGQNSSRLLLGGMLGDLSVEHYEWVAGGDHRAPDATTAQERADQFMRRIDMLFTEGMVLSIPETYTCAVLEFLSKNKFLHYGGKVQVVGLGDTNEPAVQHVVQQTLKKMKGIVANIRELLRVYRSEKSWLCILSAFLLPSPLSPSDVRAADPRGFSIKK